MIDAREDECTLDGVYAFGGLLLVHTHTGLRSIEEERRPGQVGLVESNR